MVFGSYAAFYDPLYCDKDYGAECDYLEALFRDHSRRRVKTILDLGCGTGSHALALAARGYRVTGVDLSAAMLREARTKSGLAGADVRYRRGDIRSCRLGETFDAVVSMFAVIGYQTGDEDLRRALKTVSLHLRDRGIFVFDVWFGPAVLHDPPGKRKKEVVVPEGRIVRSTSCVTDLMSQVVTVRFSTALYRGRKKARTVNEDHRMRFFFPRELSILLDEAGLRLRLLAPFMQSEGTPDASSWNVTVVAEKKAAGCRQE